MDGGRVNGHTAQAVGRIVSRYPLRNRWPSLQGASPADVEIPTYAGRDLGYRFRNGLLEKCKRCQTA